MSKMFVHYSGNKAAFAAARNDAGKLLSEVYNNYIVFIKGEAGECIYTHGAYYGDVKAAIAALEGRMSTAEGKIQANDDAIKALKYFSQIKVGDKVAAAANKEGTITFSASSPQEVAIDVDARGISFGLSEAFKTKVDTAASQAAAAAVKSEVDASIQALESADTGLGNRITALETAVGNREEGNSLAARMSAAESDIDALEGLMSGNAEGSVNARIEAAKGVASADATSKANTAESNAKSHADSLNTAMNTRMESAEGSIATLTGSGEGSVAKALVDAKDYTDAEIVKVNNAASTLEGRVKANEDALVVINGEGEGSIKKAAADAVTKVVAGAHEDFDTLKEVADWIASDTVGAAAMQTTIARLDGADTVEGSVKKQVKDAVAAEAAIARAAEQANATAINTEKSRAEGQEAAIRSEFAAADTALKNELNTEIAKKVAQSDYDTKVAELVKADSDNLAAAKTYAEDLVNGLDVTDAAVAGQYVSAVSETDGKISVTRANLPTYTLATGSANGTVAFNGADVAVKGLGSAAYTEASAYATAAQGAKADAAAPQATTYTKAEVDDMWTWVEL